MNDEERRMMAAVDALFGQHSPTHIVLGVDIMHDRVALSASVVIPVSLSPEIHGVAVGVIMNALNQHMVEMKAKVSPEMFARFRSGILTVVMGVGKAGGCDHDYVGGKCWKCGGKE